MKTHCKPSEARKALWKAAPLACSYRLNLNHRTADHPLLASPRARPRQVTQTNRHSAITSPSPSYRGTRSLVDVTILHTRAARRRSLTVNVNLEPPFRGQAGLCAGTLTLMLARAPGG